MAKLIAPAPLSDPVLSIFARHRCKAGALLEFRIFVGEADAHGGLDSMNSYIQNALSKEWIEETRTGYKLTGHGAGAHIKSVEGDD